MHAANKVVPVAWSQFRFYSYPSRSIGLLCTASVSARYLCSATGSVSTYLHNQRPSSRCRFRGAWLRFRSQSFARKCVTIASMLCLSCCGYVLLSVAVFLQRQSTVDQVFQAQEDHPIEDWALVEPTLREGDIVLMMGTGPVSTKIAAAQFLYSGMRASALHYSHVAVVVEPAQFERWPLRQASPFAAGGPIGSSSSNAATDNVEDYRGRSLEAFVALGSGKLPTQRRRKRGAVIMEAIDNEDIMAPDVNGVVRKGCVQLVEASHRLFGQDGDRLCYKRFAVRRLKGFEWTPQRKRLLRTFINENVGRPLDKSPLVLLSYLHPQLYEWTGSRALGTEVSCGEIIADLYKYCGVIRQRSRPLTHEVRTGVEEGEEEWYYVRPSIQTAPFHFAEGEEVGVLDFAEGISLGPEVRISHPATTQRPQQQEHHA
ncbi:hypothetical protein TRVL_00856 [Trypanosoma vivax]|uniref:Uncharacterized protein n=1 Tax=Trypanosoma vivax (strain Y486) TaxID=1055687 RepID=G0U0B1_TRYVY|nr:hypothetical protein TRVL_00856 [Trypanosoma vivax]CCC49509.1 conserved hypothetical protein [Trypanosoma vivax Y486]